MNRFFCLFISLSMVAILFSGCKPSSISQLQSRYVTLDDGAKVHYKVCGSGSISLLFVHGFGCDMNAWERQYQDFKNDTIRMIFVDLPGYGQSDKPEVEYTLRYFADAVKRVIDSVGVKRVVLVGHSLGTPVCRQVVFDYPAVVSALCDIDGVYCFFPNSADSLAKYNAEIHQFAESFHGDGCRENIESFVQTLAGPYTPQFVTDYAAAVMPQTPEYVAYSTMKNLVDPTYWTGEKINLPSLVICTRNSGIGADNKVKMDELYNDATYVELENTGHFIMMEDAGIVNNLLERSYEKWKTTEF